MSRRRSCDARLDRLLAQMTPPDVPAELAGHIVAETARLPQYRPREAILGAMPPPNRTLGRHAVGQRVAGLATFAAAACLAMVLMPLGVRAPAPRPVAADRPVIAASPRPEKTQQSPQLAALSKPAVSPSIPARSQTIPAPMPATGQGATLAEADPVVLSVKQDLEMPLPVVATESGEPQIAAVEGPRMSVQGPPTPIELAPAGSRAKGGLGVIAGTGAGPASTLPRQR